MSNNEELKILIDLILLWWEEHEYDVYTTEDDQYNVYDEEPEFVKRAKSLKFSEEAKQ